MQTTSTQMRRKSSGHNLKAAALAFVATLLALPGQSAVIPDIPLQAGKPVPPNIMFILDDSGSMHFEMMPDSLIRQNARYVFPRADSVYGGDDYANRVATVDDSSGYNAQTRSPQQNKIFYNPGVTYQPWLRSDGTSYPNALPTCALHNPEKLGTGLQFCRDLTAAQTNFNTNRWCNETACEADTSIREYWPATYFWHDGVGSVTERASYTKVEIKGAVSTYSGDGRAARADCSGACTYAQEIQNFANWYTYYRSRILSARAGIGRAFAGLATGTAEAPASRVGYATINTTGAVQTGVREFTGTNRTDFFSKLYGGTIPQAGTPLRRALDDVGRYYQTTTGIEDPWSSTPGVASDAKQLSCRGSYSILMTDGYWTNDAASAASDPANGDTEAGLGAPFEDGRPNTLADVAMHYWKTDLRDLTNDVPTSELDPANWQHMVTFGVGLGVVGTITRDTAFAALASKSNVDWLDPTATQPAKIDDLLHASVNSRGDFFSASDPKEFAEGLSKVLTTIGDRIGSGSNVAANSVALREDTKLFQASYKPGVWTGELQAFKVTSAGVGASLWSASEKIPATGRKLFTSTGATTLPGAVFPTATQITALGTSAKGFSIAAYLAGDRSGEIKGTSPETGDLRRRPHLLGDIVNSSPAYVKETDMLFVGANDGMMHAIDGKTGQEVFAYVPNASSAASLDKLKLLSNPSYSHKFYVDGPVTVSSYLDTPGKNYLVGALGRGGKGVYFLDVSSPATFGIGNVKGEFRGDADMGHVLGKPIIASVLIGNGTPVKTPVAIVSNGVNSANGSASLYVFDVATGDLIKKIVANSPAGKNNGLSTPRGWDSDGDGNIDNVYAGDLLGNVWKFDISSNKTTNWGVDFSGAPLFVATDSAGVRQPITGGLSIALDPVSFKPFVFFGTGKYLEQSDVANNLGEPNLAVQSWYGLKDENVAISGRAALQQRNIVVAGTTTAMDGSTRTTRGFQTYSDLDPAKKGWFVDLVDPPSPPGTARGERMVGDPFMLGRVLVAASIIPNSDPCSGGGTGFLNAIDAFTGTSVKTPFFDANGNGSFDDDKVGEGATRVPVGSFDPGVAMPTSPTIIETLVVVGGSQGATTGVKVNNPLLKARISWREILGE